MAPHILPDWLSRHMAVRADPDAAKKLEAVEEAEAPAPDHGHLVEAGSAVLYGLCSVSIAFTNKLLMTTFRFDFPVVIMILQMIYTLVLLNVLAFAGLITLPPISMHRLKAFLFPAVCYAANSVLALNALSHMNVAMYGVLKRCVPIVTLTLAVLLLKKPCPSKKTVLAVLLLTLGCVVAGYGDLRFSLLAYSCGALSNVLQALYLLLVQLCCERKMSTVETLQLNSVNTLPFLVVAAAVKQEFSAAVMFPGLGDLRTILLLILVLNMGCLLNYSLFLCTSYTSALTTSVVGGLKALAQTLIGLFTFGGVSPNLATAVGISMNVTGGTLYIYAKLMDNKHTVMGHLKKIASFSSSRDIQKMEEGDVPRQKDSDPKPP